ncbi:MAG TPA: class I SAM-dependent methyltransferase, partial [Terriglobia bacterium]|nr:class I SAM-dependent methyltransferase [Terriglobia bacterium]
MSSLPSLDLERARVEAAYGRRDARRDARLYSYFSAANLLSIQERERRVIALLAAHGLADLASLKILEVGCGSGSWLRQFIHWGARPENLAGVDLLLPRLVQGRRLCPPAVCLGCQNARQLAFATGSFDLVVASTLFSSILSEGARAQVAAEILRVLARGGAVLWYDFFRNNPANPDVRGVTRTEIERLFPGCAVNAERVTLAPPLARRLA